MTGGARVVGADRGQPRWDLVDLDSQLSSDHRARIVWRFVETLDLSEFYAAVKSREGRAGQAATDPKVLLGLWLYATLDGVGSARAIDRLSQDHTAYRWLRGGAPVNHNLLSEFRRQHVEKLDKVLTRSLTVLMATGLVTLEEVAIDGTKLRAAASPGSMSGRSRLEKIEARVAERIEALKQELDGDASAGERRHRQRAQDAAAEQARRITEAKAQLDKLEEEKKHRAKTHAKAEAEKRAPSVSTTDPQARSMRLATGATCPAWNLQVVAENGFVLTVEPTDRRNDTGLAQGLIEQIKNRCGQAPGRLLGDTRSITQGDIENFAEIYPGMVIFRPLPEDREDITPESLRKREAKRAKEAQPLQDWRARMKTDEAKEIYGRRKHIERVHAHMKNRGLARLLVRGIEKVRAVALIHAIAHNLWRAYRLIAESEAKAEPTAA